MRSSTETFYIFPVTSEGRFKGSQAVSKKRVEARDFIGTKGHCRFQKVVLYSLTFRILYTNFPRGIFRSSAEVKVEGGVDGSANGKKPLVSPTFRKSIEFAYILAAYYEANSGDGRRRNKV